MTWIQPLSIADELVSEILGLPFNQWTNRVLIQGLLKKLKIAEQDGHIAMEQGLILQAHLLSHSDQLKKFEQLLKRQDWSKLNLGSKISLMSYMLWSGMYDELALALKGIGRAWRKEKDVSAFVQYASMVVELHIWCMDQEALCDYPDDIVQRVSKIWLNLYQRDKHSIFPVVKRCRRLVSRVLRLRGLTHSPFHLKSDLEAVYFMTNQSVQNLPDFVVGLAQECLLLEPDLTDLFFGVSNGDRSILIHSDGQSGFLSVNRFFTPDRQEIVARNPLEGFLARLAYNDGIWTAEVPDIEFLDFSDAGLDDLLNSVKSLLGLQWQSLHQFPVSKLGSLAQVNRKYLDRIFVAKSLA